MDAYLLGKLSHAPSNCLEVAGRAHLGLDHGVPGQLEMGGEMEVLLDELAVGPVSNNPQAWKPSWKASPMPGCPPDSDLNAKMATRGREGRA
jgi:hypothetical protein